MAKPNEIHIVRVYDAPAKLVWDAWTDPKQVGKWWGPRGFTITTKSKDLKVGGQWVYTMHGPDGVDYPNITTYFEVEKYKKLVYDHGASEGKPPLFRVTVTFEEFKGKTVMDMTMALETPEAAKEIKKFIKQAGGNATWDRLAEHLDHEISGKDPFVINRTFEAPIAKVFEMWSNPDHFSKWLPPGGFKLEWIKKDVREGGVAHYCMKNDKVSMYGKNKYREITPVNKIVYEQQFVDKDGNLGKHPMAPMFPSTMLNTIIFTEENPNLTRVTLKTEVIGDYTQEELNFFKEARSGMTMGWSGSFDALDEALL